MSRRIDRLRAWLDDQEARGFLVTEPVNVRYLTGFVSSSAALLVTSESVHLFTDARYGEAASGVDGVDLVVLERNLLAELATVLTDFTAGPVGFESTRMTVAGYESLAASEVELVPCSGRIEHIRATKDTDELAAIRKAAAVLSTALERVPELDPVGKTERELAWRLERMMREDLRAEALSFPAIVAAGPNSARPHHVPGERPISSDELLLIDAGCMLDGYCSDCTRVYTTGELPLELTAAYEACLEIQQRAVATVCAGSEGAELDQQYRDALAERGYSVDHSLGHGVGMEIHEEPRLARTSTGELETGQVVTVEPGIYIPGVGGVRIEDMVIVEERGAEVITPVARDLVSV